MEATALMTKAQAIKAAKADSATVAGGGLCYACKFPKGWKLLNWGGGSQSLKFVAGQQDHTHTHRNWF